MANALRGSIETAEIVHSGKTRSRQTAELLHERLAPDAAIRACEGLAPNDSVEAFAENLAPCDANILVAGHMPFVSRLASFLIGIDHEFLVFQPGAVAALHRDASGVWTLAWMLTPEVASG